MAVQVAQAPLPPCTAEACHVVRQTRQLARREARHEPRVLPTPRTRGRIGRGSEPGHVRGHVGDVLSASQHVPTRDAPHRVVPAQPGAKVDELLGDHPGVLAGNLRRPPFAFPSPWAPWHSVQMANNRAHCGLSALIRRTSRNSSLAPAAAGSGASEQSLPRPALPAALASRPATVTASDLRTPSSHPPWSAVARLCAAAQPLPSGLVPSGPLRPLNSAAHGSYPPGSRHDRENHKDMNETDSRQQRWAEVSAPSLMCLSLVA